MTTIKLPANLRPLCDNQSSLAVDHAETVNEAVHQLVEQFPKLRDRLLTEEGDLLGHVSLFLNSTSVRDLQGLETSLPANSELLLVTALAGG
ncbi:MAG: ubiquitin-like small modifier protein 1 [Aureliella sp.]